MLLVNRDPTNEHRVRVEFSDAANKGSASFVGKVDVVTFGAEQYVWIDHGLMSHADPDHAPVAVTVNADQNTGFILPKASMTVLRGKISNR